MTTAASPLHKLKVQAEKMAALLKAAERGDDIPDPTGKIRASRTRNSVTFGVAMDDKFLKITMSWAAIRDTTEAGITEYIVNQMRGGQSIN